MCDRTDYDDTKPPPSCRGCSDCDGPNAKRPATKRGPDRDGGDTPLQVAAAPEEVIALQRRTGDGRGPWHTYNRNCGTWDDVRDLPGKQPHATVSAYHFPDTIAAWRLLDALRAAIPFHTRAIDTPLFRVVASRIVPEPDLGRRTS